MEPFTIYDSAYQTPLRIVVLGIGNSGKNIVDYMHKKEILGIKFIIINFYKQDLYNDLNDLFSDTDIVYITLGLGRETGTRSAQAIGKIAKDAGALTIGVVTKPFSFEGRKRRNLANEGLIALKPNCDSVVVLPCDKLLEIIDPKITIKESFKIVDSIVSEVIFGISGVLLPGGDNDINLDILDLRTILSQKGIATVGLGEFRGQNAAQEAIKIAYEFAMIDNIAIKNASAVLVHFNMHPEFHFIQLSAAMDFVHNNINESADIIFGTTTDANLPLDLIRVIIVATGFEKKTMQAVNNVF
ncbi:cell division protein FtsZ [Sulfuricurvum sp.]|uniref:cell division protein FtsZ n=1 Tax=Sulfuricurvum sp. TaxID=2025608 RepID=UPI0026300FC8|nr:cell division protein FtsZ [Sulfuricurvum sp.]MDD3595890.1 cell division protein FtsZ [Sulfuricurvum sp.]